MEARQVYMRVSVCDCVCVRCVCVRAGGGHLSTFPLKTNYQEIGQLTLK